MTCALLALILEGMSNYYYINESKKAQRTYFSLYVHGTGLSFATVDQVSECILLLLRIEYT